MCFLGDGDAVRGRARLAAAGVVGGGCVEGGELARVAVETAYSDRAAGRGLMTTGLFQRGGLEGEAALVASSCQVRWSPFVTDRLALEVEWDELVGSCDCFGLVG